MNNGNAPAPVSEAELADTVARMESRLGETMTPVAAALMRHYERLARRFEADLAACGRDVALAKASALMLVQEVARAERSASP